MIKAQRGTKDILPDEITTWQEIYKRANELFTNANCKEIRTPIFEATELFKRGVGDSTDIVNKEMYTFNVGGNETSITLRPENTAGVVRAFIEHGMDRLSPPVKLWYMGPMFRYERPQAGRQRQFHQIGVEIFGVKEATADAEAIILASEFLKKNGIDDLTVSLNSLGCPTCRQKYKDEIKKVLSPYLDELCEDCKVRYQKNPLRMLDCKNEKCIEIFNKDEIKNVVLKDFICDECKEHFEEVKKYLDKTGIKYEIDKMLVRGLDYYTRTVFEIKSSLLGAQSAILGGGRYDGLVEMLGGKPTPAVGFALGVERLYGLIEKIEEEKLDYFVVSKFSDAAINLTLKLRQKGYKADFDMQGRKFAKQLEKASKIAKKAVIIAEEELEGNFYTVKNLETGEQIKT
ncbi:TPA: histidine--tRNA ligase, partial [Candidatus Galligastranaerophilus intestinigallinarum]|nr:histidine--tRNA ligase [Candidatus Galligastranaerophilus intestinigallinarum]